MKRLGDINDEDLRRHSVDEQVAVVTLAKVKSRNSAKLYNVKLERIVKGIDDLLYMDASSRLKDNFHLSCFQNPVRVFQNDEYVPVCSTPEVFQLFEVEEGGYVGSKVSEGIEWNEEGMNPDDFTLSGKL